MATRLVALIFLIWLLTNLVFLDASMLTSSASSTKTATTERTTKPATKKYVIYECARPPCGGWSDRLKGILSMRALALLTDRQLIINMTYPCDLRHMLVANKDDWNPDQIKNKIGSMRVSRMYFMDEYTKIISKIERHNLSTLFGDPDVLIFNTNVNWINSFAKNPYLKTKIQALGYRPENFTYFKQLKSWYAQLFNMTRELHTKYASMVKKQGARKLICAQIRIGGAGQGFRDAVFNERNVTRLFWSFMRRTFIGNMTSGEYMIFITSDHKDVVDEAIVEFGSSRVLNYPGEFAHLDKERQSGEASCTRVEKVFIDFHLMSRCDMAVISRSGYGVQSVLHGKRTRPPELFFQYSNGRFTHIFNQYRYF